MSPVNDRLMSPQPALMAMILICLINLSGCLPSRRPSGPMMLSDRLVNLLIRQQLPLGDLGSPLRGEVERCGDWIRRKLQDNPSETFRLDPADNRLTAVQSSSKRMLVPDLSIRLHRLNTFFQSNAGVPRDLFERDSIHDMIRQSVSQENIRAMIRLDASESASETGGIVLADPETGVLSFHPIESDNARWIRRLQQADSFEKFSRELERILPELPWLEVRARRTLDILSSGGVGEDGTAGQQAIDSFMDLMSYYARYSYILSQGNQYGALAEMDDIGGVYMGIFHVHPPDNPPSPEDRSGSLLKKNFVLVPHGADIEVHYLDFSVNPTAEASVVRISASGEASALSGEPVSYPSGETPSALQEPLGTDSDDIGSTRETTSAVGH